jgi:peroxiredoxin family protein
MNASSDPWNSKLAVAVIAATAAVAGAAVGGFATYFGNHELQTSEANAAARGAGRVLQADFTKAA